MKQRLEEAIREIVAGENPEFSGRVGYVYPNGEESYWIDSYSGKSILVACEDGAFYAEVAKK